MRTDFWGCADSIEGHWSNGRWYWNTGEITIAARLNDRQMRYILMHELLHVLANMGHAERGIMATGAAAFRSGAATYELTEMDRAQLWLYSNPLIESGMSLVEIERMARYGEW